MGRAAPTGRTAVAHPQQSNLQSLQRHDLLADLTGLAADTCWQVVAGADARSPRREDLAHSPTFRGGLNGGGFDKPEYSRFDALFWS